MSDHASKMNRELDYLGDLSFDAGQVSIEMTDDQAADHGVHAVRIARMASMIIAMDDKKLEALLRGAGETGSATAMFRRLADSFASEANVHEKRATIMNDACGRLVVVMDRISIADAEEAEAAELYLQDFDEDGASDLAGSAESDIVVELDRGLRSAELVSGDAVLDTKGIRQSLPKSDTDPL